jgi:O-antigen ligase
LKAASANQTWARVTAGLTGALLVSSVAAFGATEPWAVAPLQVGVLTIAAAWIVRMAILPYRLHVTVVDLLVAAALLWAIIAARLGPTVYAHRTYEALLNWLTYLILGVLGAQCFTFSSVLWSFRCLASLGGFVVAIWGITQYLTSPDRILWHFRIEAGVPFGPFVNRDHYAALVILILPIAIMQILEDSARTWVWVLASATLFSAILLSGSRAGTALAIVEVLILSARFLPRRRSLYPFMVAGTLAIGLTAISGAAAVLERFQEVDLLGHRRDLFVSGIRMWQDRVWFGFGLGTFETVYPEYSVRDVGLRVDHVHSDWIEWLAEAGLPFAACLLGIFAVLARAGWKSSWGLGFPAILLHSLVDFPMQIPAIAALFFFGSSAVISSTRAGASISSGSVRNLHFGTFRGD